MIELYGISGSPYTWRVQLALEHKSVPYELRTLSISAGEHRAPAFLAKSPRGRVPLFVDGEYVLYESMAILAYVEARWPKPALLGITPEQTGDVWRVISEYTSYVDADVEAFILPIYFGRALDGVAEAAQRIAKELPRFAAQLERTAYLAGDGVTAADFTVLPHVQSLRRAAGKPNAAGLAAFLPLPAALDAWRARMEALPYYARTVPAHWRAG